MKTLSPSLEHVASPYPFALSFWETLALHESNKIELEFQADRLLASIEAWLYLKQQGVLTVNGILAIHAVMMAPTNTIEEHDKGRWRRHEIVIAGHRGVPHHKLIEAMDAWLVEHGDAQTIPAIQAAHVAYEKIHPFADGNGRTGRMIMNWQLWRVGQPIAVILAERKREYYGWFN